jgi:hypothetical protein
MNQTRPHCANQIGKTHSKPLAVNQMGKTHSKPLAVNQIGKTHSKPLAVNQMGMTHSKPLAARHGRGTAWARHAMCESAFSGTAWQGNGMGTACYV